MYIRRLELPSVRENGFWLTLKPTKIIDSFVNPLYNFHQLQSTSSDLEKDVLISLEPVQVIPS